MMDLVIIGVGGFGKEVAWLVERINQNKKIWNLLGFLDDNIELIGKKINGYKVLASTEWLHENKEVYATCAIGNTKIRNQVINKIQHNKYAILIDPSVIKSDSVKIGEGSIICAGTFLTVDVAIGEHSIINLACTIGHDVIIKEFVTVYPSVNISGNCIISEHVECGTGTKIIQGLSIGEGTIIGAGSVVVKKLPKNCVAVGVPAKPIKFLKETS